jgi:hypothetical protein
MKKYYSRIESKKRKGKIYYQPQLRRKGFWSFFNSWRGLSMLILDYQTQSSNFKIWTTIKEEAEDELKRFEHLHKVKLEQIKFVDYVNY